MNRQIYIVFLTIFILYMVFAALPSDKVFIHPFPLYRQQAITVQTYIWIGIIRWVMLSIFYFWYCECGTEIRPLIKIMMIIHAWYLIEYFLHYTSVWITWKQLGFEGNDFDGLSSHILTMLVFAYYGWKH